jgi:hypothetical protein
VIFCPHHISKSSETIFWVKILKFSYADPGSGMEKIRSGMEKNSDLGSKIRDEHPGSATLGERNTFLKARRSSLWKDFPGEA